MSWSLFSSGEAPVSWASAQLQSLGDPVTPANEQSLIAWAIQEGAGGSYNPLNTTLSADGAQGAINSAGVKNYPNWADGVQATTDTLENGGFYPQIVADLKSGKGIGQDADGELQTWGTGSWQVSIGNHWTEAASYLNGKATSLPGGAGTATLTADESQDGGGSSACLGINVFGHCFGTSVPSGQALESDVFAVLERGGLFILGGIFILMGLYVLVRDTGAGQAGTAAAKDAATAAVLA